MNNIKVGDTVKRVRGEHGGMSVGDTATVRETWPSGIGVKLKEFMGTHNIENLEVITQPVPKKKWTHTDNYGDECFIVHQNGSSAWVSYKRCARDSVVPVNSLEPIKPRITKAQAWDMYMETYERKNMELSVIDDKVKWILDNYEVTDE